MFKSEFSVYMFRGCCFCLKFGACGVLGLELLAFRAGGSGFGDEGFDSRVWG